MHACGLRRHRAPYARFTQATQGPKHASNLAQAILCDKFQPCQLQLVAFLALHALYALRCVVLLEIALNAGCQLMENVEWAKCRSNSVHVER